MPLRQTCDKYLSLYLLQSFEKYTFFLRVLFLQMQGEDVVGVSLWPSPTIEEFSGQIHENYSLIKKF